MNRIDRLHLDHPFAASRMLQGILVQEGFRVGRKHVRTLMKRMAIAALYRKPNTSKPAPGHKIYPYLLRKLPIPGQNRRAWVGWSGLHIFNRRALAPFRNDLGVDAQLPA